MRGALSLGLSRFMTLGLGLLGLVLVVRRISVEEYGAFVLAKVIATFLVETSNLGLTLVIPKYLASSEDSYNKFSIINTVIYFRIFTISVVMSLILLARLLPEVIFTPYPFFLKLFIYIPFLFASESLAKTLNAILQGLFYFTALAIINTLSAIANFIATIVFVLLLNLSTLGLIYAVFVSNSLIIVLGYIAAQIKDKRITNASILKEMLIFGFPLQMQYVLGFVYSRIDTLVIGSFLGTAGVAFYEIARKLPDNLMYLYEAFRSVYYPFISKFHADGKREETVKLLNGSNRILSILTSFGALVALLFGKEIIFLCFSQAYLPSYYAFVFLMFGLNFFVLENTLGYSLVAIGEPNKPLIVNLVRSIVSLSLNLIIIPAFSFLGASIVSVVSNLVVTPLDVYFLWKKHIRVEGGAFMKPVLISCGYGLIFLLLGTSMLLIKILFVILFILTCSMMSVVTRQDWRFISVETKTIWERLWRS